MTNARSLSIAFLVLAGVSTSALAQNTDRSNAVAALEASDRLRLDVAQMGRIEGRFLNADRGTLTLDRDGTPTEFRLGDIERLWGRGRSTGRGAWIGALVGGAVAIWVAVDVEKHTDVCDREAERAFSCPVRAALAGGLLGGVGGGLAGAGIGFAIPTWRLRFP